MNNISILMTIVDAVPVVVFLITTITIMKSLYSKMTELQYALFSAGSIMMFSGGLMKVLWKLLYALNICNYQVLSDVFMPLQSLSFIFMAVSFIAMLRKNSKIETIERANAVAVPVVTTKMPFIICTFLAMTSWHVCLATICKRIESKKGVFLTVTAYVFMLTQVFISIKFDNSGIMNWIAETINLIAQFLLLAVSRNIKKSLDRLDIVRRYEIV